MTNVRTPWRDGIRRAFSGQRRLTVSVTASAEAPRLALSALDREALRVTELHRLLLKDVPLFHE